MRARLLALRLLEDYSPFVIPNAQHREFTGHTGNVKCVEFLGEQGDRLASGSRCACARRVLPRRPAQHRLRTLTDRRVARPGMGVLRAAGAATIPFVSGTLMGRRAVLHCRATPRVYGTWRPIAPAALSRRRPRTVSSRFVRNAGRAPLGPPRRGRSHRARALCVCHGLWAVQLWDVHTLSGVPALSVNLHSGDIYSVDIHPNEERCRGRTRAHTPDAA